MHKRIIIKQFSAIWTVSFMLFFRPANYIIGNSLNRYLNYFTLAFAFIFLLFVIFLQRFNYKMHAVVKIILVLYFWEIVGSSVINYLLGNKVDFTDVVEFYASTVLFVFLCDVGFWYSPKKTIKAFLIVGVLMCSINAITMFIYAKEGGMYHEVSYYFSNRISVDYYFLGRDNATFFWSWPVLVMLWLYFYKYKPTRRMLFVTLAYNVLIVTSYIYVWSVQAMLACLSVPVILAFLFRSLKYEKKGKFRNNLIYRMKFRNLWPIGMGFIIALPLGNIIVYFTSIIQNVFQKRMTLTGRTLIWEKSLAWIAKSPVIGYGCEPTEVSIEKILINHTHNMFLETLYRGGIIGLFLLVFLFIIISKYADSAKRGAVHTFLMLMIFVFMISGAVYFAYYRFHYLIIMVCLCHNELQENSVLRVNSL